MTKTPKYVARLNVDLMGGGGYAWLPPMEAGRWQSIKAGANHLAILPPVIIYETEINLSL